MVDHSPWHGSRPRGTPCADGVAGTLRRSSAQGRIALLAVTLGSGVSILDGSIVNVAVRTIGTDLGASLGALQWVLNGYLLALASLILVGGSLGDRLGRRRVFALGVAGFALASALCALAQDPTQLVVARVLHVACEWAETQPHENAGPVTSLLNVARDVFRRRPRIAAALARWSEG